MKQKYQKWNKMLELFFEQPEKQFTLREIVKQTKIPLATAQRYVKELQEQNIITREIKANATPYFRFRKTFFLIDKLFTSDLMEYLEKEFSPSVIILFGSVRKGEYDKQSDIDIFVETTAEPKNISLKEFEKKLGHKIQLFIEKDINHLPKDLRNNIINGIKLRGYFQLK
ncbi:nucleotidyltransferase domain-containing protein [Candidatus Woesearchaeota archaeon]|nr:nucleotidyltransferase domain-containing protein [Candidatus Woesearchaeota archaeon]